MLYLTTRKNLKLQLSPGWVPSYDIQPGNGVGLFWDTKHTHTYLLTYLFSPDPHGEVSLWKQIKTALIFSFIVLRIPIINNLTKNTFQYLVSHLFLLISTNDLSSLTEVSFFKNVAVYDVIASKNLKYLKHIPS